MAFSTLALAVLAAAGVVILLLAIYLFRVSQERIFLAY